MKKSQPTFTISSQLDKQCSPLPWNASPGGQDHQRRHVVLGTHIFSNLAEKKKVNMTARPQSRPFMHPAIGRCPLLWKLLKSFFRCKTLLVPNYWCFCQNSYSWNIFWKEDQIICSWNLFVAVHCWYIKDTFAEFYQQIFEQNISEDISGKIDKKILSSQCGLGYKAPIKNTSPIFCQALF